MNTQRLDHLYASLQLVKRFFDLFFTIDPAEYTSLALPNLIQVSHCLMTLFRLSTLDYPGWDKAAVKSTVDILAVAEQIATRMGQVADAVGIQSEGRYDDPFSKLGMLMQKLRSEWEVRLQEAVDWGTGELFPSNMELGDLENFLGWSDLIWSTEGIGSG